MIYISLGLGQLIKTGRDLNDIKLVVAVMVSDRGSWLPGGHAVVPQARLLDPPQVGPEGCCISIELWAFPARELAAPTSKRVRMRGATSLSYVSTPRGQRREHFPGNSLRDAFAGDVTVMMIVNIDITGIHIFEDIN